MEHSPAHAHVHTHTPHIYISPARQSDFQYVSEPIQILK